jgi:hypothetical protein
VRRGDTKAVHPFVDRHARPLDIAPGTAAVGVARGVDDLVLAEQAHEMVGILRASLAERELTTGQARLARSPNQPSQEACRRAEFTDLVDQQ